MADPCNSSRRGDASDTIFTQESIRMTENWHPSALGHLQLMEKEPFSSGGLLELLYYGSNVDIELEWSLLRGLSSNFSISSDVVVGRVKSLLAPLANNNSIAKYLRFFAAK